MRMARWSRPAAYRGEAVAQFRAIRVDAKRDDVQCDVVPTYGQFGAIDQAHVGRPPRQPSLPTDRWSRRGRSAQAPRRPGWRRAGRLPPAPGVRQSGSNDNADRSGAWGLVRPRSQATFGGECPYSSKTGIDRARRSARVKTVAYCRIRPDGGGRPFGGSVRPFTGCPCAPSGFGQQLCQCLRGRRRCLVAQ